MPRLVRGDVERRCDFCGRQLTEIAAWNARFCGRPCREKRRRREARS
jgi:hypothetical protein